MAILTRFGPPMARQPSAERYPIHTCRVRHPQASHHQSPRRYSTAIAGRIEIGDEVADLRDRNGALGDWPVLRLEDQPRAVGSARENLADARRGLHSFQRRPTALALLRSLRLDSRWLLARNDE